MNTSKTFIDAYEKTKKAMIKLQNEHGDYEYNGYYDASALSFYLNKKCNLNVMASSLAQDGFNEAIADGV